MNKVVVVLCVICLAFWGWTVVRFAPAIVRVFRGRQRDNDQMRAYIAFVATLQIAFIVFRLCGWFTVDNLIALYVMSVMLAFCGAAMIRDYDRAA